MGWMEGVQLVPAQHSLEQEPWAPNKLMFGLCGTDVARCSQHRWGNVIMLRKQVRQCGVDSPMRNLSEDNSHSRAEGR